MSCKSLLTRRQVGTAVRGSILMILIQSSGGRQRPSCELIVAVVNTFKFMGSGGRMILKARDGLWSEMGDAASDPRGLV